jgi:lipoprotein-releasing system permease protein
LIKLSIIGKLHTLNTEFFIARRIIRGRKGRRKISRPTARIAIAGVAIGIMVMILTLSIVNGFQLSIKDKVEGFNADVQITKLDNNNSYEPAPIEREQSFLADLKKLPNVKHVQVFATKNGIIKTKTENEGVILTGVGSDYDWSFVKKNLVKGTVLDIKDSAASSDIIISKSTAAALDVDTGSKLLIFFITKTGGADSAHFSYEQRVKAFHVKGIYHTGLEDFDRQIVFTDIAQIQSLNFWNPSQIGGFEVLCNNFDNLDSLESDVKNIIDVKLNAQSIKEINEPMFSWLKLQNTNAIIIISLMALVSAIAMVSALIVLILENTNMIGLLKALGARNLNIQQIFLIDGAYLIVTGMVIGNILGITFCLLQQYYKFIPLDQSTYYVAYVPVHFSWLWVGLLNLCTFFVCMVMLILPSFIVSRITPVRTLRYS